MIPKDDLPPSKALVWFAVNEKICDASEIEDGWKFKNKDKRIQALLKLKEQNLIDGWCIFCFKNKPIGNGVQCQECVDETINSNSDKNSKSDKKPIDDGKYDYESFDDVPLPEEEKIAPISFEGLPEYSIIKQYVEYVATISDTYPEYSFQNGIGMLSAIQERKMYTRFNSKKEFLNLWQISLGLSTYARKTASFSLSQRILRKAVGNIFLPEDTTPEGFLIEMADELEKNNKNGKDEPEIEIKYNGERRRALCALWMDEAGQFLAQANKPHMLSFKQMMCKFYDSPDNYEKKLVSMRIRIGEIYFPMNMATTPTSFFDNITKSDIGTGFLPRFNITSPSYDKKRKGIIQNSINDEETENYFTEVIRFIHKLLPEEPLQVVLTDECIGLLDAWCAEREAYFKKTGNEVMSSFQGRFQANVIKYAILIELSNLPYYLICKYTSEVDSSPKKIDNSQLEKNATLDEKPDKKCELSKNISKQDQIDDGKIYIKFNEIVHQKSLPFLHKDSIIKDILSNNNNNYKDMCISKFTVSIPSLMYAIKLFDSVFIPYSFQVCVREASGIFVNYLSNIYKILQIQRKISHTDLLRSSHATKRDFEEAIESLIESGSCIVYKVKGKTKPQKVYVYVQPKLEKFNFKDYSQIPQKDSSQDNSQENFCIELSKKSKKSMTSINCQEYNIYIIGTGHNFNDIIVTAISYKKDTESAGVLTSIILKPESKNTTIEPPLRENWYSASLPLVEKPDGRECTVSHKTVFTPIPQLINVSSERIQLFIESIPKRTLNEIKSNPSRTRPIKTLNGGAQVVDYLDMMRCEVAIKKTFSGKSKKDTDVCIYTVTDDSLSNNDKLDQYGNDGRIIKYGGVSVFMDKSLYSKLNLDVNSIVEIIGTAKINTKSGSLEINAVVVKPIVKICKKIPTPQKIVSNGINHLITFNLETETLSEYQPTTPKTPIICPEISKLNDSSIKVSDL